MLPARHSGGCFADVLASEWRGRDSGTNLVSWRWPAHAARSYRARQDCARPHIYTPARSFCTHAHRTCLLVFLFFPAAFLKSSPLRPDFTICTPGARPPNHLGISSLVERPLRMREAPRSILGFSIVLLFFAVFLRRVFI